MAAERQGWRAFTHVGMGLIAELDHGEGIHMNCRSVLTICLSLSFLLSFAPGQAGEPLVRPGDRIAIFGDSISTGKKTYGFVAVEIINEARPEFKLTAFNHGHPGWRADQALKAVDAVLKDKPQVVTIMFGTNDLGQKGAKGTAELAGHLQKLIDRFQAAGIRVILLTTPYTSGDKRWPASLNRTGLPRMGTAVFALGKKNSLPVFDMYAAMKTAEAKARKTDPAFQMFNRPGDCHPNRTGHRLMGEALAPFLLGQEGPAHVPFTWTWPGKPVAAAGQATAPLELGAEDCAFPAGDVMALKEDGQILEPDRWTGPEDLSAQARAAWDETCLYVEVAVTDDIVLAGPKPPAWGHDGIEFFFDVRPEAKRDVAYSPGYFQMLVAAAPEDGPTQAYGGGMDQMDATVVKAWSFRTEKGYLLRFALPWSALRFTPQKGGHIGFDFAINDRDEEKKGRYKALWRGLGDDYNDAGSTGKLILK